MAMPEIVTKTVITRASFLSARIRVRGSLIGQGRRARSRDLRPSARRSLQGKWTVIRSRSGPAVDRLQQVMVGAVLSGDGCACLSGPVDVTRSN
jgi:hypothetical protein